MLTDEILQYRLEAASQEKVLRDTYQLIANFRALLAGEDIHTGSLSIPQATEAIQRRYIRLALRQTKGEIKQAAALLELTRAGLYKMIERLGIDREDTE